MLRSLIRRQLAQFAENDRGNVSVEFVLVMPMLFWAFMGCYVFFDGYRQSAVNLKAAYTIGDAISRETDPINDEYLDSMYDVYRMLTRTNSQVAMRISVIRWDEDDDRYYVDWSQNRGMEPNYTDGTIAEVESRLPTMPDNERVILIETSNTFVPLFNVFLDNIPLDNFIFTRPRFAPQVLWES